MAMLGITNHSKVPLRLATMAGFTISILSLLVALGYLVAKLMFWDVLQLGLAPLLIGIYFFGAVQLFFIGVLGEYIGAIHTQVHKRPLVVEKERINFDDSEAGAEVGQDHAINSSTTITALGPPTIEGTRRNSGQEAFARSGAGDGQGTGAAAAPGR